MKRFLQILTFLLICSFGFAQNWLPYQAVVRDANGELISERQVHLDWEIQHDGGTAAGVNDVTTNKQGLATVFLNLPDDIAWGGTMTPTIKVDVTYDNTTIPGVPVPIYPVPYALYANNCGDTVPTVTIIQNMSDTTIPTEAAVIRYIQDIALPDLSMFVRLGDINHFYGDTNVFQKTIIVPTVINPTTLRPDDTCAQAVNFCDLITVIDSIDQRFINLHDTLLVRISDTAKFYRDTILSNLSDSLENLYDTVLVRISDSIQWLHDTLLLDVSDSIWAIHDTVLLRIRDSIAAIDLSKYAHYDSVNVFKNINQFDSTTLVRSVIDTLTLMPRDGDCRNVVNFCDLRVVIDSLGQRFVNLHDTLLVRIHDTAQLHHDTLLIQISDSIQNIYDTLLVRISDSIQWLHDTLLLDVSDSIWALHDTVLLRIRDSIAAIDLSDFARLSIDNYFTANNTFNGGTNVFGNQNSSNTFNGTNEFTSKILVPTINYNADLQFPTNQDCKQAVNFCVLNVVIDSFNRKLARLELKNWAVRDEENVFSEANTFNDDVTFSGSNNVFGNRVMSYNSFGTGMLTHNSFGTGYQATNTFGESGGMNTFNGASTFTGVTTFAGNTAFNADNTFSGTSTFTGTTLVPTVAISPITLRQLSGACQQAVNFCVLNDIVDSLNARINRKAPSKDYAVRNETNTFTQTNTFTNPTFFNNNVTVDGGMMIVPNVTINPFSLHSEAGQPCAQAVNFCVLNVIVDSIHARMGRIRPSTPQKDYAVRNEANTFTQTNTFNASAFFNGSTNTFGDASSLNTFDGTNQFNGDNVFTARVNVPTLFAGLRPIGDLATFPSPYTCSQAVNFCDLKVVYDSLNSRIQRIPPGAPLKDYAVRNEANTFTQTNTFQGASTFGGTSTFNNSATFNGNITTGNSTNNTFNGTNHFSTRITVPTKWTSSSNPLNFSPDGDCTQAVNFCDLQKLYANITSQIPVINTSLFAVKVGGNTFEGNNYFTQGDYHFNYGQTRVFVPNVLYSPTNYLPYDGICDHAVNFCDLSTIITSLRTEIRTEIRTEVRNEVRGLRDTVQMLMTMIQNCCSGGQTPVPGVSASAYNGNYDATMHCVSIAGTLAGDQVQYSTDGGSTYSVTQPCYTNAGTYTIMVKFQRSGYQDNIQAVTMRINPAPITITWPYNTTYQFNGQQQTHTPTITGLLNDGSSYTVVGDRQTAVGIYTAQVSFSGGAMSNYTLPTNMTSNWSIIAGGDVPGVSVSSYNNVYDGNYHGVSVSGTYDAVQYSLDGLFYSTSPVTRKDVSTTTVYVKFSRANYTDKVLTGTITITPRQLTASWPATNSFTYDGNTRTYKAMIGNVVAGETMDFTYSGTTSAIQPNNYTAMITGFTPSSINYTLPMNTQASWSITTSSITGITLNGGGNFNYDCTQRCLTVSGTQPGDVVSYNVNNSGYTTTQPCFTNAGTYSVGVKVQRTGYNDWTGSATITIAPKELTATWNATNSWEYDATQRTYMPTVGGTVCGDVVGFTYSGTTSATAAGTYTATITGLSGQPTVTQNYRLPQQAASLSKTWNITKKPLTITWNGAQTVVYDGAQHSYLPTVNGLIQYDAVTVSTNGTTTASAVGTYPVSVSLSGASASNYTLPANANATWQISSSPITGITLNGGGNFAYSCTQRCVTVSGTQGGDVITYSVNGGGYTATQPCFTNAGTYSVSVKVQRTGYSDWTGSTTITIEQSVVDLQWPATTSFVYNGTEQTYYPHVTFITGGCAADNLDDNYYATGWNATDAGTYTVSVNNIGNANYTITGTARKTGTWTITPAPVTITWPAQKSYQETGAQLCHTPTVTGLLNDGSAYTVSENCKTQPGTYTATVNFTNVNNNYSYTNTTDVWSIQSSSITGITLNGGGNFNYDCTQRCLTVNGTQPGDVVSYNVNGGGYTTTQPCFTNAGTYSVDVKVQRSGYNDWTGNATITIAPKELTATWNATNSFEYNATQRTYMPTVGGTVCGDIVGFTYGGTTSATAAGTYTATITGINGLPTVTQNYRLPQQTASLSKTWTITKKPLTVTWNGAASVVFDGAQHSYQPTVNGLVQYDLVNVTTNGTTTASAVGTYPVSVSLSGLSASNYTLPANASASWEITPAPVTGITLNGGGNVTYDCAQHCISASGTQSGDVVLYSVNSGNFTATQPCFTNAGTYKVDVKVQRTGFTDWTGSTSLTISPAVVDLDWTHFPNSYAYDGQQHEYYPHVYRPDGGCEASDLDDYYVTTGSTYEATNIGNYTVTVDRLDNANYTITHTAQRTGTWQITGGTITGVTVGGNVTGTYDCTNNHCVTVSGTQSGDQISYSVNGGNFQVGTPCFKNAGTFTVTIKVSRTNYNDWVSSPVSVTISPATVGLQWPTGTNTFAYDGTTHSYYPTVTYLNGGCPSDGVDYFATDWQATNAGNYTTSVNSLDNANYDFASGTQKTGTWSITPATPTITLTDKTASETGSPIAIGAANVSGIGAAPTGKVSYTYYQNGMPLSGAPTAAGSYTVQATIAAAGNYTSAVSNIANLTILPRLTLTPGTHDVAICQGQTTSVTYTASSISGATYTWNTAPATATDVTWAPNGNVMVATYNASTRVNQTFTVTVTAAVGAVSQTASATLTTHAGTNPEIGVCDENKESEVVLKLMRNTHRIDVYNSQNQLMKSITSLPQQIVSSWNGPNHDEVTIINQSDNYPAGEYTVVGLNNSGCSLSEVVHVYLKHTTCTVTNLNPNSSIEKGNGTTLDSVADHQGNWYRVVQIGNRCWLRENMRATTSPSGRMVENSTNFGYNPNHEARYTPFKETYKNPVTIRDPEKFGLLYNWQAAMDTVGENPVVALPRRGICPEGWHVAAVADFDYIATTFLGFKNAIVEGQNNSPAGGASGKLAGSCYWPNIYNNSSTPGDYYALSTRDMLDFNAIPAGYFGNSNYRDDPATVTNLHYGRAVFWSANQQWSSNAWTYYICAESQSLYKYAFAKNSFGASVRCVRD